jgi:hypothetical protein
MEGGDDEAWDDKAWAAMVLQNKPAPTINPTQVN